MGLEFENYAARTRLPAQGLIVHTTKSPESWVYMTMSSSRHCSVPRTWNLFYTVKELTLCKDRVEKVGIRVHMVNNGIFVCLVKPKSPAALAGLKFGDQILEINGTCVAGYSMDQIHKIFKDAPLNDIKIIVRKRPFENTVIMEKDSSGHIGFDFKDGKIIALVEGSSAAKNGLLTDHQILEINGEAKQITLWDSRFHKDIATEIANSGDIIKITVIPSYIYDRMIDKMASSLLESMDHSVSNI